MTQPGDKLSEFSARWNDLRNAVIGRGVTLPQGVSQDFADRVGNVYLRWRKYLAQMPAPMALLPTAALAEWVQQYRLLADEALAAGLRFRVLPVGWTEQAVTVVRRVNDASDNARRLRLAIYAAMFALPVVLLTFGGGRRRRR